MFRPNLQNEDHRRAWALLQAAPEGQKSAFLVKAILDSARQDALESTLRRILREELQAVPSQPVQQPEETIPPEMLGLPPSSALKRGTPNPARSSRWPAPP